MRNDALGHKNARVPVPDFFLYAMIVTRLRRFRRKQTGEERQNDARGDDVDTPADATRAGIVDRRLLSARLSKRVGRPGDGIDGCAWHENKHCEQTRTLRSAWEFNIGTGEALPRGPTPPPPFCLLTRQSLNKASDGNDVITTDVLFPEGNDAQGRGDGEQAGADAEKNDGSLPSGGVILGEAQKAARVAAVCVLKVRDEASFDETDFESSADEGRRSHRNGAAAFVFAARR